MQMTPLKGIKILDCSNLLPGPYCTMILTAMGAEVVKVEPAGMGDFLRRMLPECFAFLNRGKKSITLNLKMDEAREILYRKVKESDVMLEGFRPGVAKKLGIDFEKIKTINPNIIYASISGYGQSGPYVSRPGHDIDFQAISGVVSVTGDPDRQGGEPVGFQASDIAGGIFALISILAALAGKKEKGEDKAEYFDISMTDSLIMWMLPRIVEYFSMGTPKREDIMGRGAYGVFEAKDHKYLSIGVVEEHFWERLCRLMDMNDLLEDPELRSWKGRNKNRHKIRPRLKQNFMTKDRDEWVRLLLEANITAAPVNEIKDLLADPQIKYRGILGIDEKGKFTAQKTKPYIVPELTADLDDSPPPGLGEHSEEIIGKLGYSPEEFKEFKEKGVI